MLDLAIQVVNYNTKHYLARCLGDVLRDLAGASLSYVVFVLDNHSLDDLSDLALQYGDRGVRFFKSDQNKGFGAGHNFLARQSQSRYIFILNPDVEFIEERATQRLVADLEAGHASRRAVVGPKLVNAGGAQQWDHGELAGFWAWVSEHVGGSHWVERSNPVDVAWVSGAVFLIRRSAFDEAGGFDEKFFLYKEEEDLCRRLRRQGHAVFYDPRIKIFHHGGWSPGRMKFFNQSDRYFFEKHFRQKGPVIYFFLQLLNRFKHRLLNRILY